MAYPDFNTIIAHFPDFSKHKFASLPPQKRQRIIEAAMNEFRKGYSGAVTDTITENADISKGLLFHYFASKKKLFTFLIKLAGRFMVSEYERAAIDSRDFLENLWEVSKTSIKLSLTHRELYDFVTKAYFSFSTVFPEGQPEDLRNPSLEMLMNIYSRSDNSFFKEDIDAEKAKNIILWTINGFSEQITQYGNTIENYIPYYDQILKDLEEYLRVLRKCFYKQQFEM